MSYLILIISLVGIVFGAEFLVAGSVSVARRYKVSDFVIDADIVFTAIRTRTRSTIIQTEEFYNTEIKPKYSPIEFVSCKYKDPKKISEQNDQLADEIVSAIMKEVQKITNL